MNIDATDMGGVIKLIAGVPHIQVQCVKCGVEIWVAAHNVNPKGLHGEQCSDCYDRHRSGRTVGRCDKALGADLRYNGARTIR